ncbi:MAG: copper amine oxidase N-terminal domain-containing protein, partial [Defluviitaleaceae bacterium]|nr:copper amine oxidase N-terminal domain-containing protein [Defluviitaleaceae bacterium]
EVVTIAGSGAVTVGGQPFAFDPNEFGAPHVNSNGVAVLPARMALSILFGADPMDADLFVWDNVNSAFYVDPQGRNIRFQVNNTTMWVGGVAQQILSGEGATAFNTAAYVDINQNSRLFVPLRAIAEAVGFNVSWDAGTSTVTLTPLGYTAN